MDIALEEYKKGETIKGSVCDLWKHLDDLI